MRVSITSGSHTPDLDFMVVDRHGLLLDLSTVDGALWDPTITRVDWGPVVVNGEQREGGMVYRQDGGRQPFWDAKALNPYLEAWRAAKAKAEGDQAAHEAAEAQERALQALP